MINNLKSKTMKGGYNFLIYKSKSGRVIKLTTGFSIPREDYLYEDGNNKNFIYLKDITELQTLGVTTFGENQVQEAYQKYSNLNKRKFIKLHLIGPLQSNKIKKALEIFDTIQSLDRKKIILSEADKFIRLNTN